MSRKAMRRSPTSRNERRKAIASKRACDPHPESEWDNGYGLSVGNYSGLDDRVKRRKKKNPIGFAAPKVKKGKRAADH